MLLREARKEADLVLPERIGTAAWLSIVVLIVIVHFTQDRVIASLEVLNNFFGWELGPEMTASFLTNVAHVKGVFFLVGMAVLAFPVLREASAGLAATPRRTLLRAGFVSLTTMALLAVLIVPMGCLGMGLDYAMHSISPFEQVSSWYHKRLLPPALAHILFLRGPGLYFIFNLLIAGVFLALLYQWLQTRAPLAVWQFVSLATSSFVMYSYHHSGYADLFVFTMFLLVMGDASSQRSKVLLLFFALISHEASALIGLFLARRYLHPRYVTAYYGMLGIYALVWLGVYGFNIDSLSSNHDVGGYSAIEWIVSFPLREIGGILMAFKALWILPILAMYLAFKNQNHTEAFYMAGVIAMGIALTLLGIDASRLTGFAFPALLWALALLYQHGMSRPQPNWFRWVFIVNLLIPSLDIGLVSSQHLRPGLYHYEFEALFYVAPWLMGWY